MESGLPPVAAGVADVVGGGPVLGRFLLLVLSVSAVSVAVIFFAHNISNG